MAIETWGDKPKTQIDNSTVDEEIDAKIAVHEADPDSHLEVGESLQSHKASEIIDHLARSIVRDKLQFDRYTIDCDFQSLDYWSFDNGCGIERVNELQIFTDGSLGSTGFAILPTGDAFQDITVLGRSPTWQVRAYFQYSSGFQAYIGMFDEQVVSGFGFEVENSKLYAVWFDSSDVKQRWEFLTIAALTPYLLCFKYNDITHTFTFYVNGIIYHTVVVIPSTDVTSYCFFSLTDVYDSGNYYYISCFHFDTDN